MAQQEQEPQIDKERKPRFRLPLAIVIILSMLFSAAFLTVIIILSNQGLITATGFFIGIIVYLLIFSNFHQFIFCLVKSKATGKTTTRSCIWVSRHRQIIKWSERLPGYKRG